MTNNIQVLNVGSRVKVGTTEIAKGAIEVIDLDNAESLEDFMRYHHQLSSLGLAGAISGSGTTWQTYRYDAIADAALIGDHDSVMKDAEGNAQQIPAGVVVLRAFIEPISTPVLDGAVAPVNETFQAGKIMTVNGEVALFTGKLADYKLDPSQGYIGAYEPPDDTPDLGFAHQFVIPAASNVEVAHNGADLDSWEFLMHIEHRVLAA